MSKYINADLHVEMQIYDEQYEEWDIWNGTIKDLLNQWTEQGCPTAVDIVHCGECKYNGTGHCPMAWWDDSLQTLLNHCTADDFCSKGEKRDFEGELKETD